MISRVFLHHVKPTWTTELSTKI